MRVTTRNVNANNQEDTVDTTKEADTNRDSVAEVSGDAASELLQFEAIELKAQDADSTTAGYGCGGSCS